MNTETFDKAYRILTEKEQLKKALSVLEKIVHHATNGYTIDEMLSIKIGDKLPSEINDLINHLSYRLLLDSVKRFGPSFISYYEDELRKLELEFEQL